MIVRLKIFHKKYAAMTIWPFIFIRDKRNRHNETLVNHEKIHLKQQVELFWFPFFLWYITEFLIKLLKYKKWETAYKAISFEREAYANQSDLDYLKKRKLWAFWKYL